MYKAYYYIISVLTVITMFLAFFVFLNGVTIDYEYGINVGLSVGFGSFVFLYFVQAIHKIISILENKN